MSRTNEVVTFYANAWEKTVDGLLVPSQELLQDRGEIARKWLHPTDGVEMNSRITESVLRISSVEVAEALRDILHGYNMQPSEHRVMVVGKACIALQNAEFRIRSINKNH